MDFSYVHIRYFIGYVYHICLKDTIQSTLSLCLRCQAMLLPMPLRPLLLTTRSGFKRRLKGFYWEYPYFNAKNNFSILVCAFDMPQFVAQSLK